MVSFVMKALDPANEHGDNLVKSIDPRIRM